MEFYLLKIIAFFTIVIFEYLINCGRGPALLCTSELSDEEATLVQGTFSRRFLDSVPTPFFRGEIEKAVCSQPANFLRM